MQNRNILVIILLIFIISFVLFLSSTNIDNPILILIKNYCKLLDPRFENIPIYEGFETPHTVDKEYIIVCLKDNNGNLMNISDIMYIVIHELAHIITPHDDNSYHIDNNNHSILFQMNFEMLLSKAKYLNIPVSNFPIPRNICG